MQRRKHKTQFIKQIHNHILMEHIAKYINTEKFSYAENRTKEKKYTKNNTRHTYL